MRRHVLSLVLALVLAPLVYVAALQSAARLEEAAGFGQFALHPTVSGLLAVLIGGGAYAVLVMARLSPIGPGLAGLVFIGVSVWGLVDPAGVTSTLRDSVRGVADGSSLIPGGTAFLAIPLLATFFSPRRWRRDPDGGPTGYNAAPDYPPPPDTAAPAYKPMVPVTTEYQPSEYQPSYYMPPSSPTSNNPP